MFYNMIVIFPALTASQGLPYIIFRTQNVHDKIVHFL